MTMALCLFKYGFQFIVCKHNYIRRRNFPLTSPLQKKLKGLNASLLPMLAEIVDIVMKMFCFYTSNHTTNHIAIHIKKPLDLHWSNWQHCLMFCLLTGARFLRPCCFQLLHQQKIYKVKVFYQRMLYVYALRMFSLFSSVHLLQLDQYPL